MTQHTTVRRPRGETQEKILAFILSEIEAKGYPPSVREICEAVNLKSTSTVHGHLKRLEERGFLKRDAMKPRALEIKRSAGDRRPQDVAVVPLMGMVAAGSPILAEEQAHDAIPLPAFMLEDGTHFALRVRGDSMVHAGIFDGDIVVVKQQSEAHNGDIIVAMINGDATVKRYYKEQGRIRLQAENPEVAPIFVRRIDMMGKVVSVYRKY